MTFGEIGNGLTARLLFLLCSQGYGSLTRQPSSWGPDTALAYPGVAGPKSLPAQAPHPLETTKPASHSL